MDPCARTQHQINKNTEAQIAFIQTHSVRFTQRTVVNYVYSTVFSKLQYIHSTLPEQYTAWFIMPLVNYCTSVVFHPCYSPGPVDTTKHWTTHIRRSAIWRHRVAPPKSEWCPQCKHLHITGNYSKDTRGHKPLTTASWRAAFVSCAGSLVFNSTGNITSGNTYS